MDEKELTLDYVHDTDVYVYQRKDMFRVNSDTSQLARFMRIEKGDRVLDVGTNNGALLLCAYKNKPAYLCGIDIQKEACELAQYNIKKNHILNAEIIHCDFNNYNQNDFDVIICNPPYFEQGRHSEVKYSMRSIARHEYFLQLEDLLRKSSECLKDGGRLYLVHRASRIADIIELSRKYRMEVKTIQFVHDERKEEANAVLIEAIKGAGNYCRVLNPVYLK